MNLILPDKVKGAILNPYMNPPEFSWITSLKGIGITSVQIIVIMFIIMLLYELIILWKYSSIIKSKIKFIPNAIGFSDNAFGPWIVGFFVGIAYGAGVLFQMAKKNVLKHKDKCLITLFLVLAHAVIEDSMLFVVVGGNIFWIIGVRIVMALIIVRTLATKDLYKKFLWIGLPKK